MRHPVAALSQYFYDSRRRARQKVDVVSIVRLPSHFNKYTCTWQQLNAFRQRDISRSPEVQSEHQNRGKKIFK